MNGLGTVAGRSEEAVRSALRCRFGVWFAPVEPIVSMGSTAGSGGIRCAATKFGVADEVRRAEDVVGVLGAALWDGALEDDRLSFLDGELGYLDEVREVRLVGREGGGIRSDARRSAGRYVCNAAKMVSKSGRRSRSQLAVGALTAILLNRGRASRSVLVDG
jgi:hypothetical protein